MKKSKNNSKPKAITANPPTKPEIFSEKSAEQWVLWQKIGVVLITFLVYSFAFKNEFLQWDDQLYVTSNKFVLEPFKNFGALIRGVYAGNYHPVTMLSLALNIILFGKGATSFIVVNALIHAANAYLVYVFVSQLIDLQSNSAILSKKPLIAFFTALFFGIHPMHVESVAWISERKDVLYTFFFLLACIQYCSALITKNSKKINLVFLFFMLSLLSKGMAVVLPLVLILIDFWAGNALLNNLKHKIVFLAISVFWGLLTINVQGGGNFYGLVITDQTNSAINAYWTMAEKLRFAGYGLGVYTLKLFVPIDLHHYYGYPYLEEKTLSKYYLGLLFFMIWIAVLLISYFRNNKIITFGLGFFLITIVLVLQIFAVGNVILSERYTYVPYIGALFMITYLLYSKINNSMAISVFLAVVALVFAWQTTQHIKNWKNTISLWENTYAIGEKDYNTLKTIADEYRKAGQYDKMLQVCQRGMDLNIRSPFFAKYIGNYYSINKDYLKSIEYYDKAIAIPNFIQKDLKPDRLDLWLNKAISYTNMGDYPKAIDCYNMALEQDTTAKNRYKVYKNRANLYVMNKQFTTAMPDLNYLIQQGQGNDSTYNDLAIAQHSLGDTQAAIANLKKAVDINPNNVNARGNLVKLGVKY